MPAKSPHQQYDDVARASAAVVIRSYSSSFGLATRLLAAPTRDHVRSIYALVRVADELVDAPRPGADDADRRRLLDDLHEETRRALLTGHSGNLVVHAFAGAARACGVGVELVDPFFASMRADLTRQRHDQASFDGYVHGSAEVVGLMCLRAFVAHQPDRDARYEACAPAAQRLGAAFQKVNFLRDLGEDADQLGRSYFPGLDPARLTDADRDRLLDDIDADLAAAAAAIPHLPVGSRRAVCTAHDLFAELCTRLRRTPAARLRRERVRVPNLVKARIAAAAVLRDGVPRARGGGRPARPTGPDAAVEAAA